MENKYFLYDIMELIKIIDRLYGSKITEKEYDSIMYYLDDLLDYLIINK